MNNTKKAKNMWILFEKLYGWHYPNMFRTLFRIGSAYFCVQKYYYNLSSFGMEDREEVVCAQPPPL